MCRSAGPGIIDGQGAQFRDRAATPEEIAAAAQPYEKEGRYTPIKNYLNRPYAIRLVSCRDVLVENITLRNSAMWMQHYLDCDFVTLRGLKVFNHAAANNDMVDIDGCRNVIVSDCVGDTGRRRANAQEHRRAGHRTRGDFQLYSQLALQRAQSRYGIRRGVQGYHHHQLRDSAVGGENQHGGTARGTRRNRSGTRGWGRLGTGHHLQYRD